MVESKKSVKITLPDGVYPLGGFGFGQGDQKEPYYFVLELSQAYILMRELSKALEDLGV